MTATAELVSLEVGRLGFGEADRNHQIEQVGVRLRKLPYKIKETTNGQRSETNKEDKQALKATL